MSGIRTWAVAALMMVCTCGQKLSAVPFADMRVFGDSFSDTGNVFAATGGLLPPDPPFFMGRFSDGPVWVEYLAADLGLTVTANGANPTIINGNNFAVGGAQAAVPVPTPLGTIPSLLNQVDLYLAASTLPLDSQHLYVVFAGHNDLRDAVNPSQGYDAATQQQIMRDAVDAVVRSVRTLADAGARSILVPNIADLGMAPETGPTSRNNAAASTAITIDFNARLASELAGPNLPLGTDVIEFDTFSFAHLVYNDAVNNGGAVYGITNFTVPIFPGFVGSPGADPAVSAFADDLHLSSVAQSLLAAQMAGVLVPEPSALVLLLLAAAGIPGLRKTF